MAEYELAGELRGHSEDVRGLAHLCPGGSGSDQQHQRERVISCSRDKSIRVWGLGRGQPPAQEALLTGHADYVTNVAVSAEAGASQPHRYNEQRRSFRREGTKGSVVTPPLLLSGTLLPHHTHNTR